MGKLSNIANRTTAKTGSKGKGFPAKLSNTAERAKKPGGGSLPSGAGGKHAPAFGKITMGGPMKNKKPTGKTI